MNAGGVVLITYIGGPTAILEWGGVRLLTDPTFDPAGETYTLPAYTLRKKQGPALPVAAIGPIDAVLLSHDHHFDNLDRKGRAFVRRARRTFTTTAAAARLGNGAIGLESWQTHDMVLAGRPTVLITGTPARHGPAHADRGPVTGFVLRRKDNRSDALYVSGDTVLYEGVREVGVRFDVSVAVLFLGAARVRAAGKWPLTFTAEEAIAVAQLMPRATIVPLHFEGWQHFSESRCDISRAFRKAGFEARLVWPEPGRPIEITQASLSPSSP